LKVYRGVRKLRSGMIILKMNYEHEDYAETEAGLEMVHD